jgi:hypothetical protein
MPAEGSSPERFRQIAEAYETLSDPVRRKAYDNSVPCVRQAFEVPVEPMVSHRGDFRWAAPGPWAFASRGSWETPPYPDDPVEDLWRMLDEFFFSGR